MAIAEHSLRREVTSWGSFSWGYSDVGADIFVALGLVFGAAAGASNVSFLFAGCVYVLVGLAYTELAATYPVAGGGQYFVMRGLGDMLGFVAGWAVLLDFTIDIVLFAWACVGYISNLVPSLSGTGHPVAHFFAILFLIVALAILNILGVRESTAFNEWITGMDILSETSILFFGFLFTFDPSLLVHTMQAHWPSPFDLMKGTSLAIISFVGLESISQAAQETRRPAQVIPRTSVSLILTVLIFALAYSNLALGMHPWHAVPPDAQGHAQPLYAFLGNAENNDKAVAILAGDIPYFGLLAAAYVPILGAILVLISSNSGVFGASRIAYAMSKERLLPSLFARVHGGFRTPAIAIATFCGIGVLVHIFAALQGDAGLNFLGDLYAFGAALSYSLVFLALIALRLKDPLAPRRFKTPLNIAMRWKGQDVLFPIVGVLGFLGITAILIFVLLTHEIGRIAGPSWIVLGFAGYLIYRRRKRLPLFQSRPQDWHAVQVAILRDAGELELMDEYIQSTRKQRAKEPT
ncbi:MAG: APC family permease [Candidatus Eremiobacteraeota bacterium]|nr:APC family permease [Candidatus Eremiobacteraeota bacterium]MBV8353737.1 APC family permease [Candidatus Eremiobacteraeota bacterium]